MENKFRIQNSEFRIRLAKAVLAVFVIGGFLAPARFLSAKFAGGEQSYIIKLNVSTDVAAVKILAKNLQPTFAFSNHSVFSGIYTFESGLSLAELRRLLFGKFAYLEQNQPFKTAGILVNDPGFTQSEVDVDKQWGLIKAGFSEAWTAATGSKENVVALIDTGVDGTHEDLKNINFVDGFDFFSNSPISGNVNSDDNGHGTLVAGILGASANNGKGIVGTNWEISIMPLKALDKSGKGDSAKIAQAIVWAADHGANFINLSVGGIGLGHDTALSEAIAHAFNKNVLLAAAAGNDTLAAEVNLDIEPVFPVCADNNQNMILGVTATDHTDLKPDFANFGKNCIDVAAPGKRILSTINFDPLTKKPSPNSYAYASGSSLAVPFVIGQAALIRSLYSGANNAQIRDRIISTSDSIEELNLTQCSGKPCKGLLGKGRINVKKSLETKIIIENVNDGDLIKIENSGLIFQISAGQKRPVSPFVFNQRFLNSPTKTFPLSQLATFPEGPYVTPQEGSLVKLPSSPTIFYISKGQKLPVTAQVFKQRKFKFSDVSVLTITELNSWVTGSFLPPIEGTLVRAKNLWHWVIGGVLHQVNSKFIAQRGLSGFPKMYISAKDLANFPKGEAYIR